MARQSFNPAVEGGIFLTDPCNLGKGDISAREAGELAAEMLQIKYAELFAVLDVDDLAKRLFAWIRLHHVPTTDSELSIDDQLAWAETGIHELVQRGAIKLVVETPEAAADLRKLEGAVRQADLRTKPEPVAEPAPVAETPADPVDQCARDFRELVSSDFRMKWLRPDTREVYERACAMGVI
jgi:hypothetical protein